MTMTSLTTLPDLTRFIEAHQAEQIILFKHSSTCPISTRAYAQVEEFRAKSPDIPIGLVVVQEARPLSDYIAEQYGVRHESPQIIVLRGGEVVWNDSHFALTAEAIGKHME